MNKRILLPMCILIGLLLVACGKTDVTVNTNHSASPAVAARPAATPATAVLSSAEKIGVPDCDDFLAKYEACVTDKVPEVARTQYKAGIEQWRTSWRQLAANPNTKPSLGAACKQALETTRTSMKSYNCAF